MVHVLAHVKWFVDEHSVVARAVQGNELIAFLVVLLAGLAIGYLVHLRWRPTDRRLDKSLARFQPWLPTIIGVASGLSLIIYSVLSDPHVLAPNYEGIGGFLITLQLAIGISWVLGLATRAGSVAMLALYVAVLSKVGPVELLDHLEMLAAAIYLGVMGRGRWALDSYIGQLNDVWTKYRDLAFTTFRILIGVSLVSLALSEKILNVTIASTFLQTHHWNFLAGIGVTNEVFIALIGALELLFGLMIVLNWVPRLVVLAILAAMITTASVLGLGEVYGHLFAVGLVAAVWIGNEPVRKPAKSKA